MTTTTTVEEYEEAMRVAGKRMASAAGVVCAGEPARVRVRMLDAAERTLEMCKRLRAAVADEGDRACSPLGERLRMHCGTALLVQQLLDIARIAVGLLARMLPRMAAERAAQVQKLIDTEIPLMREWAERDVSAAVHRNAVEPAAVPPGGVRCPRCPPGGGDVCASARAVVADAYERRRMASSLSRIQPRSLLLPRTAEASDFAQWLAQAYAAPTKPLEYEFARGHVASIQYWDDLKKANGVAAIESHLFDIGTFLQTHADIGLSYFERAVDARARGFERAHACARAVCRVTRAISGDLRRCITTGLVRALERGSAFSYDDLMAAAAGGEQAPAARPPPPALVVLDSDSDSDSDERVEGNEDLVVSECASPAPCADFTLDEILCAAPAAEAEADDAVVSPAPAPEAENEADDAVVPPAPAPEAENEAPHDAVVPPAPAAPQDCLAGMVLPTQAAALTSGDLFSMADELLWEFGVDNSGNNTSFPPLEAIDTALTA